MLYLGTLPIDDRNRGMVLALLFFTSLSLFIVTLRIYTRAVVVKRTGLDDLLIILAGLGLVSYLTASMYQVRFGLARTLRPGELQNFLRSLYATILAYNTTQLLVKFSLALQYKRALQTVKSRRFFTALLVSLTAFAIFSETTCIITCWPVSKYWDDSVPGGCIDRRILHYVISGLNIIIDFFLLAVPIPFLRRLQIAKRIKAILLCLFACGVSTCIVSVIRLRSLYENNSVPIEQQPLFGVDIVLWSGLEINAVQSVVKTTATANRVI
ncbi:hypothetical protein B0T17DRAFT_620777 [Bombardia bombarda]|uniref:Rhodopsin domain-containing protein n=1 Tax=Bombardia bombarda TaxID=252184 RepID=A0AA39TIF0_9PEZI|nr:hypothetical protein B0T17DRAFT_620777 [Bombardia bombarda]